MKRHQISTKLKKIYPILKDVEIELENNYLCEFAHVGVINDIKELGGVLCDTRIKSKTTIEIRPDSPFNFKKSQPSDWEIYRDNIDKFGDREPPKFDGDFVVDTYYAIVRAEDIPKFIKDSGEMINGEDRIDPLGDGKFHATHVYVFSEEEVLPMGFWELVGRMKESRNVTLHLFLRKKSAENFVKEYDDEDDE